MSYNTLRYGALVMAAAVSMHVVLAATSSPDTIIKDTTQEVLNVMKTTTDPSRLEQLARDKVAQNFDFARMTRLAVGKFWRKATPDQQRALIQQFQDLLIRTYSNALASGAHKGATLNMNPSHGSATATEAKVKTRIVESARKPVEIDYRLESTMSGWKVYDVIVDGISLVLNYRDSFSAIIDQSGIDGLINKLKEKNNTLMKDHGSQAQVQHQTPPSQPSTART